VANIAPVGYAYQGAGLWGQLDMVGDMWVWNLDWDANYTATCTDCAYLSASSKRADWGGDFGRGTSYLLPSYRDEGNAPTDREDLLGFRCARSAP
jgi:formylglycine-generating enzyme required for sulfatase activity